MRHRGRTDQNQQSIVVQLRQLGLSVQSLVNLGQGCPDLLVGAKGKNYLFELKNPNQPPSQRKLTDDEKLFHQTWSGQVSVVETIDQILEVIGL